MYLRVHQDNSQDGQSARARTSAQAVVCVALMCCVQTLCVCVYVCAHTFALESE